MPLRVFLEVRSARKAARGGGNNAADAGNILHDVLDKFVKRTSASLSTAKPDRLPSNALRETMSDKRYRGAFADVRMQGLRRQLHSESVRMCSVVRKQMASSLFVNKETEMSFGGEGAYPAVEVDYGDGKIYLNGKVDRLDEWHGRFVVIDYKSGKEASQYNEQQLYQGWQLQLPVYVKAVEQAFPGTSRWASTISICTTPLPKRKRPTATTAGRWTTLPS